MLNYAVERRSIQDNLLLVREVLEGIEDVTEIALINLDQSNDFNRVDHRFLAIVFETARLKPEFRMMNHNPKSVAQMNGKRSEAFTIERSVRLGVPCLLFSMSSFWSPCSLGIGMRGKIQSAQDSFCYPSYSEGLRVRR